MTFFDLEGAEMTNCCAASAAFATDAFQVCDGTEVAMET
jgi:hypothetical protein